MSPSNRERRSPRSPGSRAAPSSASNGEKAGGSEKPAPSSAAAPGSAAAPATAPNTGEPATSPAPPSSGKKKNLPRELRNLAMADRDWNYSMAGGGAVPGGLKPPTSDGQGGLTVDVSDGAGGDDAADNRAEPMATDASGDAAGPSG